MKVFNRDDESQIQAWICVSWSSAVQVKYKHVGIIRGGSAPLSSPTLASPRRASLSRTATVFMSRFFFFILYENKVWSRQNISHTDQTFIGARLCRKIWRFLSWSLRELARAFRFLSPDSTVSERTARDARFQQNNRKETSRNKMKSVWICATEKQQNVHDKERVCFKDIYNLNVPQWLY